MFEFRFVVPEGAHTPPPIPRLQFRARKPQIGGAGEFLEIRYGPWSDWQDVPTVALSPEQQGGK